MLDIKTDYVIVEGEATYDNYRYFTERGYVILYTDKANRFHPGVPEGNTIIFVAKPIDKKQWKEHVEED